MLKGFILFPTKSAILSSISSYDDNHILYYSLSFQKRSTQLQISNARRVTLQQLNKLTKQNLIVQLLHIFTRHNRLHNYIFFENIHSYLRLSLIFMGLSFLEFFLEWALLFFLTK